MSIISKLKGGNMNFVYGTFIDGTDLSYSITTNGDVFSWKNKHPKKLKATIARNGYRRVDMIVNGDRLYKNVHRLIAETFLERKTGQEVVRHLDGNRLNNHVPNIAWGTHKENAQDTVKHGRLKLPKNEQHSSSKLTRVQVLEIYDKIHNGYSEKELAALYGINRRTVNHIKHKEHWVFRNVNNQQVF